MSRRRILTCSTTFAASLLGSRQVSAAFPFQKERRQLELCLVVVQRVTFWAESVAKKLQSAETIDQRKQSYLEARLGAKAILTGKIGGGAPGKVYSLAGTELPSCLQDLEYYGKSKQVAELRRDFFESLATLVEFDGLDTLTDPSPRSSLTLTQFNNDKAVFVQRMLLERVVPTGNSLVNSFPAESVQQSQAYIQQYYASEVLKTEERPL